MEAEQYMSMSFGDTTIEAKVYEELKEGARNDITCAIFPSVIGTPKYTNIMMGVGFRDVYVGDEAESKQGVMNIHYLFHNGNILNWDWFKRVVDHTFYNECRWQPSSLHGVIIV